MSDIKKTNLSIEYMEIPLEDVLKYYVDATKIDRATIISHEAFIDTSKGRVVFKLVVKQYQGFKKFVKVTE